MFQTRRSRRSGSRCTLKSVSAANYINFFIDPKAARGASTGSSPSTTPTTPTRPASIRHLVMPGGSQNYDDFSNPHVTELLNEARSRPNLDKRAQLMVQAQKTDHRSSCPGSRLLRPDTILIMNKKLTGPPPTFSYMFAPWLATSSARASTGMLRVPRSGGW